MERRYTPYPREALQSGIGEFARGNIKHIEEGLHLYAYSVRGRAYGCILDRVFIGPDEVLELEPFEEFDVSGKEFRLGNGELHLRDPA